jgi:hypothetical protein
MKRLSIIFTLFALCGLFGSLSAQTRDNKMTINVKTVTGESVEGLVVGLEIPDWGFTYSTSETTLSADGQCTLNVYSATHRIVVEKEGYAVYDETVEVTGDITLDIELQEAVRQPFSLTGSIEHDVFTGKNDVTLTWNKEKPAFFDDFEGHPDWSISFGDWTGIDNDKQAAAILAGSYNNRGALQYATIVNPLTVVPTWWYEYPVLRPYSGNQYVGFVRTNSGEANDDWLISPTITVGNDNILRFMAKAADVYAERFQVGITTVENPTADDFTIISAGNYETVEYEEWVAKEYDLSAYAGQAVKIAIHYIANANRYGAFMLMVDDFYVGQPSYYDETFKLRRVQKSPANPNEKFEIYQDGTKVGETESYSYTLENVEEGNHTFGVKAVYRLTETEISTVELAISNENCHRVTLNVTTNNEVSADGFDVDILNMDNGDLISAKVQDGKIVLESLPAGKYTLSIENPVYDTYREEIVVSDDVDKNIELKEHLFLPYNITVDLTEEGAVYDALVKWNQDLGFSDSFEDYGDFVTGEFGEWLTVDNDKLPVYPIALGSASNIVSFPGSGDAYNPTAIAPMVFNPYKTVPAMAPTDPAIMAPTGDKTVIFFSPQMAQADKWLISPAQTIRDGYVWQLTAKAYAQYPETVRFCISTSQDLDSFTVLDEVELPYDEWTVYTLDLSAYAGQTVYLAVNYISTDAFLAQVDDFYVGPSDDSDSKVDVGNVLHYEVYLDGELKGEPQETQFAFTGLTAGEHTVGIKAVYKSGVSEMAEYTFNAQSGVGEVEADAFTAVGVSGAVQVTASVPAELTIVDMAGRTLLATEMQEGVKTFAVPAGVYIVRMNEKVMKVMVC